MSCWDILQEATIGLNLFSVISNINGKSRERELYVYFLTFILHVFIAIFHVLYCVVVIDVYNLYSVITFINMLIIILIPYDLTLYKD